MTHAHWPELVVGRTGRMSARRRFISGGPGARESALAASRVVLDDDQWIVEGADDEDEEIGFHIDPSFVEVSPVWLDRCRWSVSGFGRCARRENILVLGSQSVAEMRGAPMQGCLRHEVPPACSRRQDGDTVSMEITSFCAHRHTSSRSSVHTHA